MSAQEIGVILFLVGLFGCMFMGLALVADAIAHMGYGRIEE